MNDVPPKSPASADRRGAVKVILAAAALVLLFFAGENVAGLVPRFAAWVQGLGVWGPIVFATGYAVATVAMVPGSLLTLAAGAIFGLGTGLLTVFVGAATGATLAFLLARTVARSWIERRLEGHQRFATIDRAVGEAGLKIAFLLRLSPAFPFNLLNYALGLTRVTLRDYVTAHLGMLPGALLYVYYGRLAGAVAEAVSGAPVERGAGYYTLLGVGLVATVAVTTVVTRIATRALREATEQDGAAARHGATEWAGTSSRGVPESAETGHSAEEAGNGA